MLSSGCPALRAEEASPERGGRRGDACRGGASGPASVPSAPDGALYVVDFREIKIAPEKGGIRMIQGAG